MIHIAAISQLRVDSDGRAYYRRKRAEGKKPLEALRCLKRRISDVIYRQLVVDAAAGLAGGDVLLRLSPKQFRHQNPVGSPEESVPPST